MSADSDIPSPKNFLPDNKRLLKEVQKEEAEADRIAALTNPFLDADRLEAARVVAWTGTRQPTDYVVQTDQISDEIEQDILSKVQRYGLCLLRMSGMSPTASRLEALENGLGRACSRQNNYEGKIKQILPDPSKEAITGDSGKELGFHVDGTQHLETPGLLLFQYQVGPQFGGHSTFLDLAGVFATLTPRDVETILTVLARKDCARFSKDGLQFSGPMITPVCADQAVACRIRFDKVVDVHPDCRDAFDQFRAAVDATEPMIFKPREGDVAIFDNWRIMHGRKAVPPESRGQRIHDRMWIEKLRSPHRINFLLGLRPLTAELMAAIRQANS
jgi:hypothetical protein